MFQKSDSFLGLKAIVYRCLVCSAPTQQSALGNPLEAPGRGGSPQAVAVKSRECSVFLSCVAAGSVVARTASVTGLSGRLLS